MFVLAPFIAWLISGSIKFIINYFRFGNEARSRIGNGGFPSTHTTILSTITVLVGWSAGFNSPVFGLGIAITFIVIIDATGLRRMVGHHAQYLNEIKKEKVYRESVGHSKIEVLGGIILGLILGTILYKFL